VATRAREHAARLLGRATTQQLPEVLDGERLIIEPGREVPIGLDERFESLLIVVADGRTEARQ
jgi:hypothetical protein